ncbi:MAG: 3-methyl-2-oxobutanoate hydroxymethyltransferase [Actinobacteria bacterium]|nr:3-methyl-2-oxobutanoate hydroxymethyltransferase [Actinomycetota bacterium]
MEKKILPNNLLEMKHRGEKITMTVCYDFPSAILSEKAGIHSIIMGVSVGKGLLGYDDAIKVKVEDVLHHTKAVSRGAKNSLIIADMPFLSCTNDQDAIKNCGKMITDGGANAVKIEGGGRTADIVKTVVKNGIPVLGHIGASLFIMELDGGVEQGTKAEEAIKIIEDVKKLEDAGVFAILMEAVPFQAMEKVMEVAKVPIISLGSGKISDGQLLIFNELIGLQDIFIPKCVKRYANVREIILKALKDFISEVEEEKFPLEENTFFMAKEEIEKLNRMMKN